MSIVEKYLRSGLDHHEDTMDQRAALVLNQFLLLAYVCAIVSVAVNVFIDHSMISVYYGVPAFGFLLAASWLNSRGFLNISAAILFLFANAIVSIFTVALGLTGLAYLYFFPLLLAQMYLFASEKSAAVFYSVFSLTLVSGIVSIYYAVTHGPSEIPIFQSIAETSPMLNIPLCFGMTSFMVVAFMRMQRKRERSLHLMINEKQTLLSEVHHRVKNNLAIISSLLNLQKNSVEEVAVQRALDDSRNRIYTMALIHEKLYKNQTFSSIGFFDYADSLLKEYVRSSLKTKIKTEVKIDGISLVLGQAIPCGLILNELITNSIKHGFRERKDGEIQVEMWRDKGKIHLHYHDNGQGVSDLEKLRQSESLGMTIIQSLSEQLGGQPQFSNENGLHLSLAFPEEFDRAIPD